MIIFWILKTFLKSLFFLGLSCILIILLPGLPPNIQFEAYKLDPVDQMDTNVDFSLDRAEIFSEENFGGAESYAFRKNSATTAFASTLNGSILKIEVDGEISRIAQLGVPVGIKFDPKGQKLFIADVQLGIIELDVNSGYYKILLESSSIVGGRRLGLINALDVSSKGEIYFSETSEWDFSHLFHEVLGQPSGRLLKLNPSTKICEVLLDKVHFANGIQLSKYEDYLLLSEFMRSRILRYFLKGSRAGENDIFITGLPGFPDNIRSNEKNGFFISLYKNRDANTQFFEKMTEFPLTRKLIVRVYELILNIFTTINENLLNLEMGLLRQIMTHYIIPMLDQFKSKGKVVILEVDGNGKILKNFQNKNLSISGISELTVGYPYSYLGAPFTNKMWRIKTKYLQA